MIKFFISFFLLLGLIYLGNKPIPTGETSLPAIGKFFSPATGFWQNGNNPFPDKLNIPNLAEDTQIYLDERGVPHIFSGSYVDAVRVQGFLHAQNRLFQMDVSARFTAGRLSEILGERMLEIDKLMRRRGLPWAAEKAVEGWNNDPQMNTYINAYCDGVNAYIDRLKPKDYPIEYKLLNAKIEHWSPMKSALIGKSLAFDLCFRNHDDIATKALELIGPELYKSLFPQRYSKEEPIIPAGTAWKNKTSNAIGHHVPSKSNYNNSKVQEGLPDEGIGSNNWAVAAAKTKNGAPILCNDPHLRLRLPSIWYELQINTPEANVYGVSLPGVPSIFIGFNEHLAWGVTNVGMDVLDWYKIKWTNENKTEYILDQKQLTTEKRVEKINIKNAATVFDTVNYTVWGPLTYDFDTSHSLYDYALRWVGHNTWNTDELGSFIQLNHAKTFDDFERASKSWRSPLQNMICATKANDIALRISGAIPIRDKNQGVFLLDGSTTANSWKGFVDPNENPMSVNPDRDFVSSANQISTDSTYPYPYHGYFSDYRGRILNQKLATMSNITVKDMMDLQQNNESILADEALPLLLKAIGDKSSFNGSSLKKINQLSTWNRRFEANNIEGALFLSWFNAFYKMTWDEFNREEISADVPEYWRTLDLFENEPQHSFFDIKGTTTIETADAIARLSFARMVDEIDALIEEDADFNWGAYNGNKISHLLNLPAFSSDVNQVDGFKYALNATNATNGPSWRMVVELSDPIRAWGHYPGGQSGHPGHKYYDNMIEDWTQGNYYELNFMKTLHQSDNNIGQLINCPAK